VNKPVKRGSSYHENQKYSVEQKERGEILPSGGVGWGLGERGVIRRKAPKNREANTGRGANRKKGPQSVSRGPVLNPKKVGGKKINVERGQRGLAEGLKGASRVSCKRGIGYSTEFRPHGSRKFLEDPAKKTQDKKKSAKGQKQQLRSRTKKRKKK